MSSSHHSSQAATAADAEAVINAPVKLLLEDSDVCLDGSVTITKTTLVVFKTDSPTQSEEPLFLGVSSIPLLQFYRHNEMLTLLRGGGLLFDNASPFAGLPESHTNNNAAHPTANPPLPPGSTLNKPTMWEKLTLQFDSAAACSRVVSVLRRRHAEELQTPPLPVAESSRSASASQEEEEEDEVIELSSNRRSPQEPLQSQSSKPLSRTDGATYTKSSLTASALRSQQSNGHDDRLTSATNSSLRPTTTNATPSDTRLNHQHRVGSTAASESRSATTEQSRHKAYASQVARDAATPNVASEDEVPRYSASHRSVHSTVSSAAAVARAEAESTPRDITRERLQLHRSQLQSHSHNRSGSGRHSSHHRDYAGSEAESKDNGDGRVELGSNATRTTTNASNKNAVAAAAVGSRTQSKSQHSARHAHSSRDGSTHASSRSTSVTTTASSHRVKAGNKENGNFNEPTSGQHVSNESAPTPYTRIDLSSSAPNAAAVRPRSARSGLSTEGGGSTTASRLTRETPAAVAPALSRNTTASHDALAATHTTERSAARHSEANPLTGCTPVTSHMTRHTSDLVSARSMSSRGTSGHYDSNGSHHTTSTAKRSGVDNAHGVAAHETSSSVSSASVGRSERSSISAAHSSQHNNREDIKALPVAAAADLASTHSSASSRARRRAMAAAAPPVIEREYRPGVAEARRLLAATNSSAQARSASASQHRSRHSSSASPGRSNSVYSADASSYDPRVDCDTSNKASSPAMERHGSHTASSHHHSSYSHSNNNIVSSEGRNGASNRATNSSSARAVSSPSSHRHHSHRHRPHSSSRHGSTRRSRSSAMSSSSSSGSSLSQHAAPRVRASHQQQQLHHQTPLGTALRTTPSVASASPAGAAAVIVRAHSATSSYRAGAPHTSSSTSLHGQPQLTASRQAMQGAEAYSTGAIDPTRVTRGAGARSPFSHNEMDAAARSMAPNALNNNNDAAQTIAQLHADLRSVRADNAALRLLLRSAQKLQHHRLHLIQYLHKELVHQAYLVEVAKVITATESIATGTATSLTTANSRHVSRSTSQRRRHRSHRTQSASVSVNRPHRQTLSSHSYTPRSSPAETAGKDELARLQELEKRLAEIEVLHAEAQRDRDEAARLRQDCAVKQDELTLRLSSLMSPQLPGSTNTNGGGIVNVIRRGGSRPNSELTASSTGYTPKRASMANLNVNTAPGYNNNSLMSNGSPVVYGGNAVVKAGGSRRGSNAAGYSLAVVSAPPHSGDEVAKYIDLQGAAAVQAQRVQRLVEADLTSAVLDRYVFGNEWAKLYPTAEVDVRFCAQIDLCLALQLPRRQVIVTGLAVDQPGLRVTLEVRYEPGKLPREVIERRVAGCPCRFLQRLYDMRHLFHGAQANVSSSLSLSSPSLLARSSRSPAAARRHTHGSVVEDEYASSDHPHNHPHHGHEAAHRHGGENAAENDEAEDDVTSLSADEWLQSHRSDASVERSGRGSRSPARYAAARRAELDRRMRERVQAAEAELAHKRARLARELKLQVQKYLIELEDSENYARESLMLDEARKRQDLHHSAHRHLRATAAQAMNELLASETVARAGLEVGAARQLQALTASHRRHEARLLLQRYERERRDRIVAQEASDRAALRGIMLDTLAQAWQAQERLTRNDTARSLKDRGAAGSEAMMGPGEAQNLLEKLHRTQSSIGGRLEEPAAGLLRELDVAERLARAAITSAAMSEWVTLMYNAATTARTTKSPSKATALAARPPALATRLRACQREEAAAREELVAEQARRRTLYAREYVVMREIFDRDAIERDAYASHDALTDDFLARHRAELERRLRSHEALQGLLQSEQFYRDTVLGDEQDDMELITELFATGLADILAKLQAQQRQKTPPAEDELDYPRHRPPQSPRVAKPFHYMTFSPEDMDHGPSAALALEAILGCSINKNLEVVSISRPLPKATEEELQFQAADMILDVAGFSLHSLSHLREVLSARAMQIQSEAREEFPELDEAEYTSNPALQKYIEMLCEHHNFLVQVLRGCDIYQIIVRS